MIISVNYDKINMFRIIKFLYLKRNLSNKVVIDNLMLKGFSEKEANYILKTLKKLKNNKK